MHTHLPLIARLLSVALAACLAGARPTAAQTIVAPTFPVGSAPEVGWYSIFQGFDVAAAADGGFGVGWIERQSGTSDWALVTGAFDATGAPRHPLARLEKRSEISDPVALAASTAGYAAAFRAGDELSDMHVEARFFGLDGTPASHVDVSEESVSTSFDIAAASVDGGVVFLWRQDALPILTASIWTALGQPRSSGIEVAGDPGVRFDVAGTHDGGFVVAFESDALPKARFFDASGAARGPVLELGISGRVARVAASPAGDVVALAVRQTAPDGSQELWIQRIDSTGTLLGTATFVQAAPTIYPDLAFDRNGNLYVVWAEGTTVARARGFDRDGVAIGPAIDITSPVYFSIRTDRLADGRFVNVWQQNAQHYASIVSLCTPGTSTCGDGTFDTFCEACDDGAGNSDVTPDACRTDCELPHCGDAVTDGGEECDDGNGVACDGCSACRIDVGLGCGDGIAIPACGEACDDGNAIVGDGCGPDCRLERSPGGGPKPSDCFTEWSIDNPANDPLLDKRGAWSRFHTCVDDDPRCDFDGGTPGGCTFHVRVCVNNTDLPACTPGSRLAGWQLKSPSAARAENDPVAAAQRSALNAAVLPNVVGPTARDLCSPTAAVVLPLRSGSKSAKLALKTDAALYTGARDIDKLRLACLPAAP